MCGVDEQTGCVDIPLMGFALLYPSYGMHKMNVGWVECNETHHDRSIAVQAIRSGAYAMCGVGEQAAGVDAPLMGFASLYPSDGMHKM
jgi:hypothetical protein